MLRRGALYDDMSELLTVCKLILYYAAGMSVVVVICPAVVVAEKVNALSSVFALR
uniref:Uncharacterized protein n=1 Tax=Daucus carota subsp. sativus TaxID=79200 RepID=A0A175YMK7_DAUCS